MGSSGGGSSGNSVTDTTYHFSPYLESNHQQLLADAWAEYNVLSSGPTPWDGFDIQNSDLWFLGALNLAVTPVYDIVKTYVTGQDLEALWAQLYTDSVNDPVTNALIAAEETNLQDDIDQNALPRMASGLRDINAVMSSSFIYNKTLIQALKTKAMATFAANIRAKGIDVAVHRWTRTLDWNIQAVDAYIKFSDIVWKAKFDSINNETNLKSQRILWPFTCLDMVKGILSTLNGAGGGQVKGSTPFQAALSGVLGGMSMLGNTSSAMAGGYKALQSAGAFGAGAPSSDAAISSMMSSYAGGAGVAADMTVDAGGVMGALEAAGPVAETAGLMLV